MRSIRFQFMSFIAVLLLILLLLLNTIPMISSRNAVFEEKRSSMSGQANLVASSLAGLDRLSRAGIAEVLSFLDISGFSRIVVADETGTVVYDNGGRPHGPGGHPHRPHRENGVPFGLRQRRLFQQLHHAHELPGHPDRRRVSP